MHPFRGTARRAMSTPEMPIMRAPPLLPSRPLRTLRRLLLLPLLAAAAGCEVGDVIFDPEGGTGGARLTSGSYSYRAWSDGRHGEAWWGYLELRVASDGRISGSYRLPWQCTDRWRREVDCVGQVGGRLYRDGSLRFGLDEGWLSHEGNANRYSEVTGRWWTRILGHSDAGTFELRPRRGR